MNCLRQNENIWALNLELVDSGSLSSSSKTRTHVNQVTKNKRACLVLHVLLRCYGKVNSKGKGERRVAAFWGGCFCQAQPVFIYSMNSFCSNSRYILCIGRTIHMRCNKQGETLPVPREMWEALPWLLAL